MSPASDMSPAAVASSGPEVATQATPIKPVVAPVSGAFNTQALFAADKRARETAALELAKQAKKDGPSAFVHADVATAIVKALNDKKSPAAREGACKAISIFVSEASTAFEPIILNSAEDGVLNALLETFADKMPAVRNAALKAVKDLTGNMSPWASSLVVPALLKQIKTNGKCQVKQGACQIIDELVAAAHAQVAQVAQVAQLFRTPLPLSPRPSGTPRRK